MIAIHHAICERCATCLSICPVDAMSIETKLIIDEELCISCGKCVRVCPVAALELARRIKP